MGMGSPGEVLRAYSATRSVVWRSIVWGQGRVSTSVAARYHPLRCRYASWTSPPRSSASIVSPTRLVRAVQSDWREFQIALFVHWLPVQHSRPVRQSIVRLPTNLHVSGDIQSLCGWCFGSGWTSDAFSFSLLTSHFVLLPGWERYGEPLAVSLIGLEGPISPFPHVSDNRAVIGIMDRRRSEANLPELRDPILPSHDVIWLGVYPLLTTLLAPCPAFPSLLEAAPPNIEFARRVNQVDFVQQVGDCRLPFVTGVLMLNVNVEVAHDDGAAVGRARFPCRP